MVRFGGEVLGALVNFSGRDAGREDLHALAAPLVVLQNTKSF